MKPAALLLPLTLLVVSCGTAPPSECPRLPPPPALGPVPPPFLPRMQTWLSGSPLKPTDYGLTSKPVEAGLKR